MSRLTIHRSVAELRERLATFAAGGWGDAGNVGAGAGSPGAAVAPVPVGLCGFDGFIDRFVRIREPATMAGFGAAVAAAAGVSTSFSAEVVGEKFGGNGPLLAGALHAWLGGAVDLTYIGAVGDGEVAPRFREALLGKMRSVHAVATPAHSDCLEFTDGKVMLCDLRACADMTWERVVERVGEAELERLWRTCGFVAAVNWGKLPAATTLWRNLGAGLRRVGRAAKSVRWFMDLAEFAERPEQDRRELVEWLPTLTAQCTTLLSLNLKEAWQLAELFGGRYHGQRSAEVVAELTAFLRDHLTVDRVVVHPNDGAACASVDGCTYVPGPVCRQPLISVGAGDHFGAGVLGAMLREANDVGLLLSGVCTSGYFVRTGHSPRLAEVRELATRWMAGSLGERL